MNDSLLANAIRVLSMDAVENVKSGHPGMPMGMADIATVLWREFLHYNPQNPKWWNRDRFVLSNGHGSMLLYSLLHLTGFDLSIEDLKHFRTLHSKTPGHPEYGYAPGIETTTGPLGQGFANAVGMALAEKILAREFNTNAITLIDHRTYVFLGDGCLMEGISHEAAALAGTLKLGKLIAFWDDNGISIDGEVHGWFTEDTPKRFEAYGWRVIRDIDGHDANAVRQAIAATQAQSNQPTLICCKTTIGFGSPNKAGQESCHGAPLGADEIKKTRARLNWNYPPFEVPAEIYAAFDGKVRGEKREQDWNTLFIKYSEVEPEKAAELSRRMQGDLPDLQPSIQSKLNELLLQKPNIATRKASQDVLNMFVRELPELLGGSADLTSSNLTFSTHSRSITPGNVSGNYIHYGVREFGMCAIANGLALYGGFIPYVATFLIFSDYARNAIRMSALMRQRIIYVMTHDSIGLGEDGPTHQPVEQLSSLRLIPNLSVWRPCDSIETLIAWGESLKQQTAPSLLALSRQNLQTFSRTETQINSIRTGGYLLSPLANARLNLIATGSEVQLAMDTQKVLQEEGIMVNVISMPCLERFLAQTPEYQEEVLQNLPMLVIEAGVTPLWYKLVKNKGTILGIDQFGESGKAEALFDYFGFTVLNVMNTAKALLGLNL